MLEQILKAKWNTTRDLWEETSEMGDQASLFSERLDVFSETLPTSGMTRSGQLFELPTLERVINERGCSSSPSDPMLRTPIVSELEGGPQPEAVCRAKNQTLKLTGQILDLVDGW